VRRVVSRRDELLQWFDTFAACVRRRDLGAGEQLFRSDVVAFGTRTSMMNGLLDLKHKQWAPTWNATSDFRFDPDSIRLGLSAAGDWGWGVALWMARRDGDPPFERQGRGSFVFAYDDGWRCLHSHLSYVPSGEL
jgi:ketosteroid isomerase-like protein